MAITKVSALTEITSTVGTEELLINDGGTSKKIQVSNLPDTDTNTNQLTTFTVSATTDTTPTTISQGDDLMFTAGTGITCETTADGTVTISNTVTDTDTTYSTATTSTEGLVKIEDGTAQSTAANAVTTTASRTYGVQLNASDQAVVNVPWTDTDTDTTYTAGDGLALASEEFTLDLTKDQSWTGSQRGTPSVVTDGTLDLNTANNFKYTPAASPDTLEFTNETAGQSGFITVINASGHTIATGSEVKKSSTWDISTAGTYLVSYYSDGTNVYLSASAALAT